MVPNDSILFYYHGKEDHIKGFQNIPSFMFSYDSFSTPTSDLRGYLVAQSIALQTSSLRDAKW
jgi:hypothetical protein